MNEQEIMQKIQTDIKLIRDRHQDMEKFAFRIKYLALECSNDMDVTLGELRIMEAEKNEQRRKESAKGQNKGIIRKKQHNKDRNPKTENGKEGKLEISKNDKNLPVGV